MPDLARSLIVPMVKATMYTAGRAAPQRTIGPKISPLSRAAAARTAAVASGALLRQASGRVISSAPAAAAALP